MTMASAPLMNATACARLAGLSVRALRLYEQRGLVRPVRDGKGWRLYGPAQIAALASITTLKSLGLSLKDIATLMRGSPGLAPLLKLRAAAWRAAVAQAQEGLLLTEAAHQLVASGHTLSLEKLCELIRSMKMTTVPKSFTEADDALFTPEEQAGFVARKAAMKDDPTHGAAAWAAVIARVKALIAEGAAPHSEAGRAAARDWLALVQAFSGGDTEVETKSAQLWQNALQADPGGRELPFGQAEWEFVRAAARADREG